MTAETHDASPVVEQDSDPGAFMRHITVEAVATIGHADPCVPECLVCFPQQAESDGAK
jgi:hypothetical protein